MPKPLQFTLRSLSNRSNIASSLFVNGKMPFFPSSELASKVEEALETSQVSYLQPNSPSFPSIDGLVVLPQPLTPNSSRIVLFQMATAP